MKNILIGFGLLVILLLAGCTQTEGTTQQSNPSQTSSNLSQPTQTYACPDGSIVTDLSSCPKQTCSDGTAYSSCSSTKPKYCSNGQLTDKASLCGCPTGYDVTGDSCIVHIDKCNDGTLYWECAQTKPKYCNNGVLTDNASVCGCPSGLVINSNICTPASINFLGVVSLKEVPITQATVTVSNPQCTGSGMLFEEMFYCINNNIPMTIETTESVYNLSSTKAKCLLKADVVQNGNKLILLEYYFSNPTTKMICIDNVYQLILTDANDAEFGAKSPGGITGTCSEFPYFSGSLYAPSNSNCLDAGEKSKTYKLIFTPQMNSVPSQISYQVDYETVTQSINN